MTPQERSELAMSLFREGYNCCQAVILAFSDVVAERTGMTREQIVAAASGFGGGFARLREVCGSVSGMTFLAGALSPAKAAPAGDDAAMRTRRANYALVQEFAAEFRNRNGSIVCRELLSLKAGEKSNPEPEQRTKEYYSTRPCERLIGSAAAIVAEHLDKFCC